MLALSGKDSAYFLGVRQLPFGRKACDALSSQSETNKLNLKVTRKSFVCLKGGNM